MGNTFNYSDIGALIAPRPFMVERGHFDQVAPDDRVGLTNLPLICGFCMSARLWGLKKLNALLSGSPAPPHDQCSRNVRLPSREIELASFGGIPSKELSYNYDCTRQLRS